MNNSTACRAAQRYAAAYDSLSTTTEQAVVRAEELSTAAQALAGVNDLLASPSVPLTQKQAAVQAALKNWPQVASFVEVLLAAKRYNLLAQIVADVYALADKRQGILRAQIVSARPLSDTEKQHAQRVLSTRYGQDVKAVFRTDKEVLGGLKIWCNGELLDGSFQGQLDRLQEELIK